MLSECPSESELHRYHARDMATESIAQTRRHLEECTKCNERDRQLLSDHRNLIKQIADQLNEMNTATAPDQSDHGLRPAPDIDIEGYTLLGELSRGGQGIVYKARQESTGQKVAVKILLDGALASDTARLRFEREIALVAQLKHESIIRIYQSGVTTSGLQFYVMDYVKGVPLNHYLVHKRPPLDDTLQLFLRVCNAVKFAHQHGVIHRDLKPSNILVDDRGNPILLDFGLAKIATGSVGQQVSVDNQFIGTLPYMSPEQVRRSPDEIDIRTDVYALGVILYEMLTGHYPYPVIGNMEEVLKNIAEAPPVPPRGLWTSESGVGSHTGRCPIDRPVEIVVLKALKKEPDLRYQSVGEFAKDVHNCMTGDPISAEPPNLWTLLIVSCRRHRKRYATAAAIGLLATTTAALGAGWIVSENDRLKNELLLTKAMTLKSQRDYGSAVDRFDEFLAANPITSWRSSTRRTPCASSIAMTIVTKIR